MEGDAEDNVGNRKKNKKVWKSKKIKNVQQERKESFDQDRQEVTEECYLRQNEPI